MPAKSLPLVSRPRVTVLIPAPSGWGRGIIKGITMYANRHGPWQLHVEAEGERRSLPLMPIAVAPLGIITRQSTDTFAIDNHELLQALRFIRENAVKAIRRVRLERAKHLLATTDLTVPRVAAASGFSTGHYLATVFRQETGITPLKYRAAASTGR